MTAELERVAMVLLHQDGNVLIQHRDTGPGAYAGGMWGLFGGHIEGDESGEDAARREIDEELDLRLEGPLEFLVHRIDEGRERSFFAAPLEVPTSALTLREGQEMALVPHAGLDAYPVIPIHAEVIRNYFAAAAQHQEHTRENEVAR